MSMARQNTGGIPVREARRDRAWSQQTLATRIGVSRAEVSAIENGRLTPSIATALRLAAALGRSVEDLFALTDAAAPSWAWPPPPSEGRYWEASIGRNRLLFPAEPTTLGSLGHDGRCGPGGLVPSISAGAPRTLVLAGCDPAVGLLGEELMRREGIRLLPLARGSREALGLLERGLVHAAGVHWSGERGGDANAAMVSRMLGSGYRLVHVARWQEGVALEASVRTRSAGSLARANLRWVAREEGSGARRVLDRLLGVRARRFRHVARDHRAVAVAIRTGYAQAGVAVKLVAEEAGLDFIALQREDYDLCYREDLRGDEALAALRRTLRRAALRRLVGELPGYDSGRMGEERAVA
jgi:molybdate-binding protein/DNA-binding XRE family transcriptional regulator